tara:strand:+ start:5552 stop:6094 length:543 start_codon:yes stop_codon:yes gene_type:complete
MAFQQLTKTDYASYLKHSTNPPDNQIVKAKEFNKVVDNLNLVNPTEGVLVVNSFKKTPTAANATAVLTAAQVKTGYITSTSAAATNLTLPTGTLLGAALGASQGFVFDLVIDNTGGASAVALVASTNAILADYSAQITAATASVTPAAVTPLTVTFGTTGTGVFRLVFSSATAYTFTRIG